MISQEVGNLHFYWKVSDVEDLQIIFVVHVEKREIFMADSISDVVSFCVIFIDGYGIRAW